MVRYLASKFGQGTAFERHRRERCSDDNGVVGGSGKSSRVCWVELWDLFDFKRDAAESLFAYQPAVRRPPHWSRCNHEHSSEFFASSLLVSFSHTPSNGDLASGLRILPAVAHAAWTPGKYRWRGCSAEIRRQYATSITYLSRGSTLNSLLTLLQSIIF